MFHIDNSRDKPSTKISDPGVDLEPVQRLIPQPGNAIREPTRHSVYRNGCGRRIDKDEIIGLSTKHAQLLECWIIELRR